VEPDLEWEQEQYASAAIDFESFQLRGADPARLLESIADADILVVDQAKIPREVIAGLSRCKVIIRHGDGYDNLDVSAATEAGIVCANKPGFWSRAVAEQTLLLALSIIRKFPAQSEIAAKPFSGDRSGWDLTPAKPMQLASSLCAGVVGYGKIGESVAELFSALFDRVLIADPELTPGKRVGGNPRMQAVSHGELYANADLVSLHVPANAHTIGMINASVFAKMKAGSFLVNTSRGSIVQTDDLVSALEQGQIAGAALDVTDPEPLPKDHPLRAFPSVVLTPHLGWYAEGPLWALRKSIVEDVFRARDGKPPLTPVNREVLSTAACRVQST
jgi:D-3-phosphoglycerate dehydrogenase